MTDAERKQLVTTLRERAAAAPGTRDGVIDALLAQFVERAYDDPEAQRIHAFFHGGGFP